MVTLNNAEKELSTLDQMIDLMGKLRNSGHDLDCYSDEMHAVRTAIHSARIAHVAKIREAEKAA